MLGGRLKNFKQKKPRLYAFSHECEDHTKSKVAARGNFFERDGKMMFHCYHCSTSSLFSTFLNRTDPTLYKEYRLEIFRENKTNHVQQESVIAAPAVVESKLENKSSVVDSDVIMLSDLPIKHPVLEYVKSRMIPEEFYTRIGVVSNFYKFAGKYDESLAKINTPHPRLLFPFYDSDGSIICYSGRSFGNEKPKYVNVMVDKSKPKVYGLWRINKNKDIIAVEGQIDSLFLDNAIAIGSANYTSSYLQEMKDRVIILPDSDWKRNRQVYKSLLSAVELGFRVSIIPDSVKWKDVNDMIVKGGLKKEKIMEMVTSNVVSGVKAKFELNHRKKF